MGIASYRDSEGNLVLRMTNRPTRQRPPLLSITRPVMTGISEDEEHNLTVEAGSSIGVTPGTYTAQNVSAVYTLRRYDAETGEEQGEGVEGTSWTVSNNPGDTLTIEEVITDLIGRVYRAVRSFFVTIVPDSDAEIATEAVSPPVIAGIDAVGQIFSMTSPPVFTGQPTPEVNFI
jgi:hypothetical protein